MSRFSGIYRVYDTVEGNALAARAKYIVSNVELFQAIPKKEDQIFVNTWHGSGVKAHDYYNNTVPSRRIDQLKRFNDQTDLFCLHSLDDRFRLCAMLHYDMRKCVVTGQPRLDCIKQTNGREELAKALLIK